VIKRIGVTLGDPCGIGPEIVLRSLVNIQSPNTQYIIYGFESLLRSTATKLKMPCFWKTQKKDSEEVLLKSVDPTFDHMVFDKNDIQTRARATMSMLDQVALDCQSGYLSGMVTAPIDKSVIRSVFPKFTGHTEYLAQKAQVKKTIMLLDNSEIRVALLTNHISLKSVADAITKESFESTVQITVKALREWFLLDDPKIAVAGINPHAGELVENSEEERTLKPVIKKFQEQGLKIEGPFPADSLFPRAREGIWDVIFSPYHDQGLVAAKYPGIDKVVNITLGLPYLRVSPGHGVAYDLVGEGRADIRSIKRALQIITTRNLVN